MRLPSYLNTLAHHAETSYPIECCGLVVRSPRGELQVRPGQNLEPSGHTFELDPGTIIDTRKRGESIAGLYHSHCDGPATLSIADTESLLMGAVPLWPGVEIFVASVQRGRCVCVQRFVWNESMQTYEPREF